MKKCFVYLIAFALFGCSAGNPPGRHESFTAKPLVINTNEDSDDFGTCQLSITGISENDSTVIYNAKSSYQGRDVGLVVCMPKAQLDSVGYGSNIIVFKSLGPASDRLLMVFAKLYNLPISLTAQFISQISFDYVNLDVFSKTIKKEKEEKLEIGGEYKLFFPGDDSPEIFMNIDPAKHWIQFQEKDTSYRSAILKAFSK